MRILVRLFLVVAVLVLGGPLTSGIPGWGPAQTTVAWAPPTGESACWALSPTLPENARKAQAEFCRFRDGLKPADLATGCCVKNSTDFYARLLDAKVETKNARIVLLVREPNQGMPNPMYPAAAWIHGEAAKFWIWHAFVVVDGWVFDANYRETVTDLKTYFNTLWGTDPNRDAFWVFAVPLEDFPNIAGSSYPGGPPRMLRFKPITWQDLVANPHHVTVAR